MTCSEHLAVSMLDNVFSSLFLPAGLRVLVKAGTSGLVVFTLAVSMLGLELSLHYWPIGLQVLGTAGIFGL